MEQLTKNQAVATSQEAVQNQNEPQLRDENAHNDKSVHGSFESSSVPTTLPTAYDVYPLDGRHDGGYYTVKDCVTIDVLPRTPGNNVYVGFMVWSNFTATKCRGLVSLNQVIKEII